MTQENIILYPRSYNKRGDESLHSVQGVTPDGEEVNVKLRIPANAKIIGVKPSIAEFAREDYGAKNVCRATPDNGPNKPGGMLLFTGCEPDGSNRKGMTSYIARWAHRLCADDESPAPIQGIGRVDVAKPVTKHRGYLTDIKALREAKPLGWEERVSAIEAQMNNPIEFQYQLRMYRFAETQSFSLSAREEWEGHFSGLIDNQNLRGATVGAFVRVRLEGGKYLPEIATEMLPLFMKNQGRFQSGAEVLQWLYRKNPELPGLGDDAQIVIVPIESHTAGTVFRKHYGAAERYNRLLQQYYPGDRAELCHLVASRSMHEGEPMLLRVHPLTPPLAIPAKLAEDGTLSALMVGEEVPVIPQRDMPVEAGLNGFAPLSFPSWFTPIRIVLDEGDIDLLPDPGVDKPDAFRQDAGEAADEPEEPDEMIIIDDIFEVYGDPESHSEAAPSAQVEDRDEGDVFDRAADQIGIVEDPEPILEPEMEPTPPEEPGLVEAIQPLPEGIPVVSASEGSGMPAMKSDDESIMPGGALTDCFDPKALEDQPVSTSEVTHNAPFEPIQEPAHEPEAVKEPLEPVLEPMLDPVLEPEMAEEPDVEGLASPILTEQPEVAIEDIFPQHAPSTSEPQLPDPEPTLAPKPYISDHSGTAEKPKPKGLAGFMARKGLLGK
ncbi:hypothetical protein [Pseudomonas amygdali]|uniref:Uncharacterized protein n=2 Tax=Pseudomonas amygdali pv. lachrymans TaxID=53707 RepID=A0ABR5KSL4_PSEAV|nr:hypothetical protein [Pseudomonas amygdali]AXH59387.1 hypothetical protein PLA107_029620 [Pseudomonas amygdali pv. lachrymans str. M301315]KPC17779.1 Uncharacterized protein AC499_0981 [Pseudomonas amygdali pv. lachrymans]RMT05726.1 hypothetical protein ALP54_102598 [Pseudomonas amygdali pv. lachrymans]